MKFASRTRRTLENSIFHVEGTTISMPERTRTAADPRDPIAFMEHRPSARRTNRGPGIESSLRYVSVTERQTISITNIYFSAVNLIRTSIP